MLVVLRFDDTYRPGHPEPLATRHSAANNGFDLLEAAPHRGVNHRSATLAPSQGVDLRAINQYFLDCMLASRWGFEYLAERFHDASFEEMRDAEKLMDRILPLGGLPNLQRTEPVPISRKRWSRRTPQAS